MKQIVWIVDSLRISMLFDSITIDFSSLTTKKIQYNCLLLSEVKNLIVTVQQRPHHVQLCKNRGHSSLTFTQLFDIAAQLQYEEEERMRWNEIKIGADRRQAAAFFLQQLCIFILMHLPVTIYSFYLLSVHRYWLLNQLNCHIVLSISLQTLPILKHWNSCA